MSYTAWLAQAENDLEAAKVLSTASHHSQAVWLATQAVEKAHKAILVALGLQYQEKHFKQLGHDTVEISKLLPAALHDPVDPQVAPKIALIEERATASRYPAPTLTATGTHVVAPASSFGGSQRDVADAAFLLDWCRVRIARAVRASQAMKP